MRQIPELIDGQRPAAFSALLVQRGFAIELLHLCGCDGVTRLVIGQKNAQLFKRLANARQRLGDACLARFTCGVQHGLAHAGQCVVGRVGILRFQPATGEYIGIGEVALIGAARHQYLVALAVCAVAQQQDGGGVAHGGRFALRIQELAGTWVHAQHYAKLRPAIHVLPVFVQRRGDKDWGKH